MHLWALESGGWGWEAVASFLRWKDSKLEPSARRITCGGGGGRPSRGGLAFTQKHEEGRSRNIIYTAGINHHNRGAKPSLLSPRQQMGKALLPGFSVPLIWHNSPSNDEMTGKNPNLKLRELKFDWADELEMSHCWEFGFHLQWRWKSSFWLDISYSNGSGANPEPSVITQQRKVQPLQDWFKQTSIQLDLD